MLSVGYVSSITRKKGRMSTIPTDDLESPLVKDFYSVQLNRNDRFGPCIKHSSGLKIVITGMLEMKDARNNKVNCTI